MRFARVLPPCIAATHRSLSAAPLPCAPLRRAPRPCAHKTGQSWKQAPEHPVSLWLRPAFLPHVAFLWGPMRGLTLHSPGVGTSTALLPAGARAGRCNTTRHHLAQQTKLFAFLSSPSPAQPINSIKIQPESSSTSVLFFFCRKRGSLCSPEFVCCPRRHADKHHKL